LLALTPLRVDVDSSPVYELLLQVAAFTGQEELGTYDVGHRWGVTQRARCSTRVRRALDRLGGPYAFWDQLLGYQAAERAESVRAFVELIAQADPIEMHLHMLGFYSDWLAPELRAAIHAAATGSRKARAAVLQGMDGDPPARRAAMVRLLTTPAPVVKDLILESLTGWYERIFVKEEAIVVPLLADDARARGTLMTTDPERLILIATGVRYASKPDVDMVLLIPTLIMRPWLAVVDYRRTRIYCYPILDDPGPADSVPPALLRMYEALADPARLRILKALGNESLSVDQLCAKLSERPEAVRAHLARLRVGRLVQLNCGETTPTTYERRTDLMRAIGQPLKSYLQLPTASP
jgi:DNA-binding transcriptional ArsR family regulator